MQISSLQEMAELVIEDLPTLTEGLIRAHVSEYIFEGDDGEIFVEEEDIKQAMEELETMANGFVLASCCAKDKVECAFDDEQNEFIFWKKKGEEE